MALAEILAIAGPIMNNSMDALTAIDHERRFFVSSRRCENL